MPRSSAGDWLDWRATRLWGHTEAIVAALGTGATYKPLLEAADGAGRDIVAARHGDLGALWRVGTSGPVVVYKLGAVVAEGVADDAGRFLTEGGKFIERPSWFQAMATTEELGWVALDVTGIAALWRQFGKQALAHAVKTGEKLIKPKPTAPIMPPAALIVQPGRLTGDYLKSAGVPPGAKVVGAGSEKPLTVMPQSEETKAALKKLGEGKPKVFLLDTRVSSKPPSPLPPGTVPKGSAPAAPSADGLKKLAEGSPKVFYLDAQGTSGKVVGGPALPPGSLLPTHPSSPLPGGPLSGGPLSPATLPLASPVVEAKIVPAAAAAPMAPVGAQAEGRRAALLAAYTAPDAPAPLFAIVGNRVKDLRSGEYYLRSDLGQLVGAGVKPRVIGELPGFVAEGLDAQGRVLLRRLEDRTVRALALDVRGVSTLVDESQAARKPGFMGIRWAPRMEFRFLPAGIPQRYLPAINAYIALMKDKSRVHGALAALEREVAEHAFLNGVSARQAMDEVLAAWEKRHGFAPAIDVTRVLNKEEFRKVLSDGTPFHDLRFLNDAHGAEGHRIQWNLLMRDMAERPKAYGELTESSELYRWLGDKEAQAALNWRLTGAKQPNLWDSLFDSLDDSNFCRPERMGPNRGYFPLSGDWVPPGR